MAALKISRHAINYGSDASGFGTGGTGGRRVGKGSALPTIAVQIEFSVSDNPCSESQEGRKEGGQICL